VLAGVPQAQSRTEASLFRGYVSWFHLGPLDPAGAEQAAKPWAELSALEWVESTGEMPTAGIALAGGHTLVSRDKYLRNNAEATGFGVEAHCPDADLATSPPAPSRSRTLLRVIRAPCSSTNSGIPQICRLPPSSVT
jgi:hypothetical protein